MIIEDIIKIIKNKYKFLIVEKFDAISIQITDLQNNKHIVDDIDKFICCNINIPFLIEENSDDDRKFLIQFPDFLPSYNDEEEKIMYENSFKWLITNLKNNSKNNIDYKIILRNKEMFVKQAIQIHYKSNINNYKTKLNDLLDNTEYRTKILNIFIKYINQNFSKFNKGG